MDWKKIVGAVAPTLATALQAGGPDALLRLKQADQAFAVRMQELGIDLERVHANDRADARGREVKTGDKATPRVLAGLIVGGFLLMVWFVLAGHVGGLKDPVAAGLIGTLIGYVSAKADQVVSYYFGSSAGSAEKTALLGKR